MTTKAALPKQILLSLEKFRRKCIKSSSSLSYIIVKQDFREIKRKGKGEIAQRERRTQAFLSNAAVFTRFDVRFVSPFLGY